MSHQKSRTPSFWLLSIHDLDEELVLGHHALSRPTLALVGIAEQSVNTFERKHGYSSTTRPTSSLKYAGTDVSIVSG